MVRNGVRWEGFVFFKEPFPRGQVLFHLLTPEGMREKMIAIHSHMRGRDLPWFVPLEIVVRYYKGRIPLLEDITFLETPSPFTDPLTHGFQLLLGEILTLGIPEGDPHPRLYSVLNRIGLQKVDPESWGRVPVFIFEEMGIFHLPSLCPLCGRDLQPEMWVEDLLCHTCAPGKPSLLEARVGKFRLPLVQWLKIIERILGEHLPRALKTPTHLHEILLLMEAKDERDSHRCSPI